MKKLFADVNSLSVEYITKCLKDNSFDKLSLEDVTDLTSIQFIV